MTQPATVTLRPPGPDDRADWQRLWTAYLAFYETELPASQVDLIWRRIMDGDGLFALLAVGESGAPVGLAHYLYHPSFWTDGPYCYLQDLYVDPEVRGTGAGRAMIEELYRIAEAAGAAQVYWLTQDFNQVARRLYDRVGQVTPFIKYRNP